MGRRILAIAAAAVIALVGAVLVLLYARGADQRAVAAASPATVYVTAQAVPSNTTLKDAVRLGQVVQTQVPAASKPAGALESVDDTNSALVALSDIGPGQIVLAAAFGEQPQAKKALDVDAGKLAVSLTLSDPARVGAFVTPGSYITIFMTYGLKDLGTDTKAKAFNEADLKATSILLDNVKVIAMGPATLTPTQPTTTAEGDQQAQEQQPQSPAFLVTVEVNPQQAAKLIHGINNYTLYAGLRGAELKVDPKLTITDQDMAPGLVQ
jgi:pilus assembly protein CpaB